MLFLAKSITVGRTDVRTERKRRRFRIGTPALRRRLAGAWSALGMTHRVSRMVAVGVKNGIPDDLMKGFATSSNRKAVNKNY